MAVTDITPQDLPLGGYNLSDSADFTALGIGADNGVQFAYAPKNAANASMRFLALKNSTGGLATFTLKFGEYESEDALSAYGVAPSDPTIEVADGKVHLVKLSEIIRDSDGKVVVECDVAGEALAFDIS